MVVNGEFGHTLPTVYELGRSRRSQVVRSMMFAKVVAMLERGTKSSKVEVECDKHKWE